MSINTSDVARLVLAPGDEKAYMTEQEFGGHNILDADVFGDKGPTPAEIAAGRPAPVDATVEILTSEDNSTFTPVDSVTVVPGGQGRLSGIVVGPYFKITCAGNQVRVNLRQGNQIDANPKL